MASKKIVKKVKAAAPKTKAKPAPKKAAPKKAAPKKPAVKKTAVKKPAIKVAKSAAKKPAKAPPKAAVKVPAKAALKAPASKPAVAVPAKKDAKILKPVAAKKSAKAKKVVEDEQPVVYKTNLNAKELAFHKDLLLKLRERVVGEMNFLAKDNLNRSGKDGAGDLSSYSFHMADQGTDNFDREFAANLLSGEQDVLFEIEEALRRVEGGSYGICEMSGEPIERERLKFLPHARYSVVVQSQMEKGKPRFRPFKRTSIQQGLGSEP